jgi:hypothetical protein
VGMLGRVLSGLSYTPWVDGDVNGDGIANDRAFVFAANEPSALSDPMTMLLAEAPAGARACLGRQQGRVAARNSCRGPWLATLDAQATLTPGGQSRRVRFAVTATNLAGAADYLLHGDRGLRGWGQPQLPEPVLLHVRGFDPASRSFRYEVNPGFGRNRALAGGMPFSLTLQARVRAGADPARQWIADAVRASRRYGRRPSEIAAGLAATIPNFPAQALAAADTAGLALTPAQRASLQQRADSTRAEIDAIIGLLAPAASAADTSTRVETLETVRRLTLRTRTRLSEDLTEIRQLLSPEQWVRLPPRFREAVGYTSFVPPRGITIETPDP